MVKLGVFVPAKMFPNQLQRLSCTGGKDYGMGRCADVEKLEDFMSYSSDHIPGWFCNRSTAVWICVQTGAQILKMGF
jgi:hypothetical protein